MITGKFKIVCFFLSMQIGGFTFAQSQPRDTSEVVDKWKVFVSGGYKINGPEDISNYYEFLVGFYIVNNIRVKTQRQFPDNIIFEAEAIRRWKFVDFGWGVTYSWTSAYSLYEDYSGTLDFTGRISVLNVFGQVYKEFGNSKVKPYVSLRPGVFFGHMKIKETIKYNDFPTLNSERIQRGNGIRFSTMGAGGLTFNLWDFIVSTQVSYLYARLDDPELTSINNGEKTEPRNISLMLDYSGPAFQLKIGKRF